MRDFKGKQFERDIILVAVDAWPPTSPVTRPIKSFNFATNINFLFHTPPEQNKKSCYQPLYTKNIY